MKWIIELCPWEWIEANVIPLYNNGNKSSKLIQIQTEEAPPKKDVVEQLEQQMIDWQHVARLIMFIREHQSMTNSSYI